MSNRESLFAAATIAHLLEYIDTGRELDYLAALSTLKQSGLIEWTRENSVMVPLRRDGYPQADRFTGEA